MTSFNAKGWLRDFEAAGGRCDVVPGGVAAVAPFIDRNRDRQRRCCTLVGMIAEKPDRIAAVRGVILARP